MEYPLLSPEISEEQIHAGCQSARELGLAQVTVRPSDVEIVSQWLRGSGVAVGSVVGYPHGSGTTSAKVFATRDLLQRGAARIETVLNVGKMLSRQFQYIELELLQMAQECRRAGATLMLDLELPYLGPDHRVIACRIARRAELDSVRAVSAFGPSGSGAEDRAFLVSKLGEAVRVDGGVLDSLDEILAAHAAGIEAFATNDPRALLDAWRAELKRRETESSGL
jgi:deoxyribose-phosphate aldolase